jgi:hypothetical protein
MLTVELLYNVYVEVAGKKYTDVCVYTYPYTESKQTPPPHPLFSN